MTTQETDLFEHYESLPDNVREIVDKYCDGNMKYEQCAALKKELEAVGYTCSYGLDAEPYELRKIN